MKQLFQYGPLKQEIICFKEYSLRLKLNILPPVPNLTIPSMFSVKTELNNSNETDALKIQIINFCSNLWFIKQKYKMPLLFNITIQCNDYLKNKLLKLKKNEKCYAYICDQVITTLQQKCLKNNLQIENSFWKEQNESLSFSDLNLGSNSFIQSLIYIFSDITFDLQSKILQCLNDKLFYNYYQNIPTKIQYETGVKRFEMIMKNKTNIIHLFEFKNIILLVCCYLIKRPLIIIISSKNVPNICITLPTQNENSTNALFICFNDLKQIFMNCSNMNQTIVDPKTRLKSMKKYKSKYTNINTFRMNTSQWLINNNINHNTHMDTTDFNEWLIYATIAYYLLNFKINFLNWMDCELIKIIKQFKCNKFKNNQIKKQIKKKKYVYQYMCNNNDNKLIYKENQ